MGSVTEPSRRDFLSLTACAMGLIAAGAAGWVAIDSLNPAADTIAGHGIYFDLSAIKPGERALRHWHGKNAFFIYRRTPEELKEIRAENWCCLRDPESDQSRVKQGHDEWLLVVNLCTYRFCPLYIDRMFTAVGAWGGWQCACCGSAFDKSGRVRSGPAPRNLYIPSYTFESDTLIRVTKMRSD